MEDQATEQPISTQTLIAGRYQVREALPPGALCAVYLGEDTILRRPVITKVVPAEYVAAYQTAQRATALLAHPAMVLLLDAIEQDGRYILVEEAVRGDALSVQLDRGLTSEKALNLGLQLARLLAYTHRRGVVHGDLTPASVLSEADGTARVNNFCLPPDRAYFARSAELEAQLARGVGAEVAAVAAVAEVADENPLPALDTPASDLRALGLMLARGLTTASPSGQVRAFGADVPADLREVVLRLVLRGHAYPFTEMQQVLGTLEQAKAALAQRVDDPQETPPAVRRHRTFVDQMAPWSEADTQLNVPPWHPGAMLGAGVPPATGHYAVPPTPLRAPVPTGPFDGPGVAGVPPAYAPIDEQWTVPTPMPPAPTPPDAMRAPGLSGPLRAPGLSGPLRAAPSGPLRAPIPSGPLRSPGFTAPLRAVTPSGPLGVLNPSRPLRAPTSSGPLRQPSSAPLPQRTPVPSGQLRGATPTGPLRAYGAAAPIQSYRVPSALPWSDDPRVQEWVEGVGSRPLHGLSRPRGRSGNMGWLTTMLIALLLFAICFAVGYFMPVIIPFR